MKRGLYIEAYRSFLRLCGSPIAAAKEIIYLDSQLQAAEAQLLRRRRRRNGDAETNAVPMREVGHESLDDDEFESNDEDGSAGNPPVYVDGPRGFNQRITAWWRRMWHGNEDIDSSKGRADPFVLQFRDTNYLNRLWNLFRHPRVRRACEYSYGVILVLANLGLLTMFNKALAAAVVMISQQLCGVRIRCFFLKASY
jgi:hypothetical protein